MASDLRTAVITGSSAGLGVAVALEMARRGWRIALGARRVERLEDVAREVAALGGEPFAHALDVTDSDSIDRFFAASEQALGTADIVVNNAGCSRPGLLSTQDPGWLRAEVETNLLGPLLVTRRALIPMREQALPGDIVFMSSDAVRNPRPYQVTYGSTKAALENLSDGLGLELEGTGIRCTKIRIGPSVSEFGLNWADVPPEVIGAAQADWKRVALRDARTGGVMLPAEKIAQAVMQAVEQPRGVLVDTIEVQPEVPIGGPVPETAA
ncbi:SDR family NAD(P)-dependent oxidoreductase [Myxococcota bacterium]|nr:SDR family NAD(P)-dependent oxidoreductase [Myxococcota bacterium]